jgi:hypothetical protein
MFAVEKRPDNFDELPGLHLRVRRYLDECAAEH